MTATGLEIVVLGGVEFVVDGETVDFSKRFAYRGIMMQDVPNMISTFGYINASWTLRADLIAQFTCRLLAHMQERGYDTCTPRLRPSDADMKLEPYVTGFSSGYLQRVMEHLPKQGDREPWRNPQDYLGDRRRFLEDTLEDGSLDFERRDAEEVSLARAS